MRLCTESGKARLRGEGLASGDAWRSSAALANDLDCILNALLGLGDEWMRRVSGARDDRSRG